MIDRIPPHNPEAEQALLGCMMLKLGALHDVLAEYPMAANLFYDDRHGSVFEAMRDLNSNDPVAVFELIRNRKIDVGGIAFIACLSEKAASGTADEVQHYAKMLVRDYVRRELVKAGMTMQREAFDSEDSSEALESAEKAIMAIGASLQNDSDPDIKTLAQQALNEIEQCFDNKGRIRGLGVGFGSFDWMTHGLKAGQVIILAARPGVGKTSLAMNIAEHVAIDQKYPVGVFSLEMTGNELIHRMACSRARVDSKRAQEGSLTEADFKRLSRVFTEISNASLHICEKGGLTLNQLAARARRMHAKHKLKLGIVDYLQLMRSTVKGNRNEQITEISNGLKALAKDLGIPLIVLSQLSRDVEKSDREPRLSDLRDSGSIEQDADLVLLLSPKPIKAGNTYQEVDGLIPKHRGGPVGKIELLFNPSLTRFETASPTRDVETPPAPYTD